MTDEALILMVERARRGEACAFDGLVRRYQNMAVGYARSLLRDQSAAEDAAQEAFVQAWRDLQQLKEPAAFAAWLRRIVFKFCDRARRSAHPTLPLDDMLPVSQDLGPVAVAERADEAARVRAAVDALPRAQREITFLYYMTGHDVKEIAAFLETPPSTVKNRLHAARKRLRKELWTMAETKIEYERPSKDHAFAANVLARVLREFQDQEAADPHAVNRDLLGEGRASLLQMLADDAPLSVSSVRDGFILLGRKSDWPAMAALLSRYLTQPLPDSEAAWAYLSRADAIDMSADKEGALLANEAFERWLPGKRPVLTFPWPCYPAGENTPGSILDKNDALLLCLGQGLQYAAGAVLDGRRNRERLAKVDAALAVPALTDDGRLVRHHVLAMAARLCERAGDFERALGYGRQMAALAEGAENKALQAELRGMALGHEVRSKRREDDDESFASSLAELTALMNASEAEERDGWVQRERHLLACDLVRRGKYALALPFLEANASNTRQMSGGWGWLMYAAAVWSLTQDRERTLGLLQKARVHSDQSMRLPFAKRPEFAGVREDPEFLQALCGE